MEKLLANEIRDNLKLYLGGVNFLSEFTFGNNGTIADLLDVNNRIIGYEIKSDSDSYTRLPKQIKGYDSVCRKVYMVVGASKAKTVFTHIPEYYGVIVAMRQDEGSVAFEVLREALDNTNWDTSSLLRWLPSEHLKRLAKSNPSILGLYGGRKTSINKLPKYELIKLLVRHSNSIQIEKVVLRYLRSDELQARRVEARRVNQAIKHYEAHKEEREKEYRLKNWKYLKEDLWEISNGNVHNRAIRLYSIGRNYLPLSVEYNLKGIHNGYFVHNDVTNTVDFLLKADTGCDNMLCVSGVLDKIKFLKLLHRALSQEMSLLQLRVEINRYIDN